MPKTPQFIIDMKSHPRSMKHGYRRPSPPAHGNPSDRTSSGDDGAIAFGLAVGYPTRFNTIPLMPLPTPPDIVADHLKHMQEMMAEVHRITMVNHFVGHYGLETTPPAIPHAGIHAGEFTGWRIWWVDQSGWLRSVVRDEVFWIPGKAMQGNVNERAAGSSRYAGVYSFKNRRNALSEFKAGTNDLTRHPHHAEHHTVGLALGTVKLWGEVVEHEHGYRASFAKPASIDETYYYGSPAEDPKELYF